MQDITTLTVRLPREDKESLMKYAEDHDLSASQIVRQLIRKHLFHCNIPLIWKHSSSLPNLPASSPFSYGLPSFARQTV